MNGALFVAKTGLSAQDTALRVVSNNLANISTDGFKRDRATFEDPHQVSVGMHHVFVNGVAVVDGGVHTGALPGRAVRGPGWTGWQR